MNICYLVGAGDITSLPKPDSTDLVIAADGGYDHLISHGVRCDLLIGDLDSIKGAPKDVELMRHPIKKDDTDMILAFREGVRRGYRDFLILGGTGGRIDHTLANMSLLLLAARSGYTARLSAPDYTALAVYNSSVTLNGQKGATLSVFALGGKAEGVSIKGAEYELSDGTLTPDFPLGVSNKFTDKEAEISVKNGSLLVIYQI